MRPAAADVVAEDEHDDDDGGQAVDMVDRSSWSAAAGNTGCLGHTTSKVGGHRTSAGHRRRVCVDTTRRSAATEDRPEIVADT